MLSFKILNIFRTFSSWGSSNYRPSAPLLYEVASYVKNCHSGHYYYLLLMITSPLRSLSSNPVSNCNREVPLYDDKREEETIKCDVFTKIDMQLGYNTVAV